MTDEEFTRAYEGSVKRMAQIKGEESGTENTTTEAKAGGDA